MVQLSLVVALGVGVVVTALLFVGLRRFRSEYESAFGERYARVVTVSAGVGGGAFTAAVASITAGAVTVGPAALPDSGFWPVSLACLGIAVLAVVFAGAGAMLGLRTGGEPRQATREVHDRE